jgi:hypothetical protein
MAHDQPNPGNKIYGNYGCFSFLEKAHCGDTFLVGMGKKENLQLHKNYLLFLAALSTLSHTVIQLALFRRGRR